MCKAITKYNLSYRWWVVTIISLAFSSNVSIQAGHVETDIKPESCPNPFHVSIKGTISVAILGTEDFKVEDILPESVELEGVPSIRWNYEDVSRPAGGGDCDCTSEGPDGYMDLVLKFDKQAMVNAIRPENGFEDGEILLPCIDGVFRVDETENTYAYRALHGCDCVVINQNKCGRDNYVAYWNFNETEGEIVYDSSDNAYDGLIIGANRTGNALDFNGFSDYVEIADVNGYPPEKIGNLSIGTISVWFKFDSVPPDRTIHPIFYFGDGTGGTRNSSLQVELGHFTSNSKLYFTVFKGGGDEYERPILCFDSRFNLQTDTWYHFAAVVGKGFNTGYLNGEEMIDRRYNFGDEKSSFFFDTVFDQKVCWIGKGFLGFFTTEDYFDGLIDEVRIYDRCLTKNEIECYYNQMMK